MSEPFDIERERRRLNRHTPGIIALALILAIFAFAAGAMRGCSLTTP